MRATEHLCGTKWRKGPITGCPHHGARPTSGIHSGYTQTTRTYRVDGPPETNNLQREHVDGRLDAKVNARTIKIDLRPQKARAHG